MVAKEIIFTSCYDPIRCFDSAFAENRYKEISQVLRRIEKIYQVVKECKWIDKTEDIQKELELIKKENKQKDEIFPYNDYKYVS